MRPLLTACLVVGLSLFSLSAASAEDWTLDGSASNLSFGSIKNNSFGEAHHFEGLTGSVSEAGKASIAIDLSSVETYIDIRNERMVEHLFGGGGVAELKADLDMTRLQAIETGQMETMELDAELSLLNRSLGLTIPVIVLRLSEEEVLVLTDGLFFVAAEDLDFEAGLVVLQQLAGLDGITATAPVTFRLLFSRGDKPV
ncbi:MAG: YceI family protein [Pseudomonadota bacterium]